MWYLASANTQAQQHNSLFPIPPQVKTADFNLFEQIFYDDDVDNTGYFHTTSNEAMKPIYLIFNGFPRTRICQFTLNTIQDERRRGVQKAPW